LAPGEQLEARGAAGRAPPALHIEAPPAYAGSPVTLRAHSDPARVFWWLDAERGAVGHTVTTRYVLRGSAPIEVLAVSADGRVQRARADIQVRPRRAFGCAVSPVPPRCTVAGLLALVVSWKLACARRLRACASPGNRNGRRSVAGGR
jgi:hypothetical protein